MYLKGKVAPTPIFLRQGCVPTAAGAIPARTGDGVRPQRLSRVSASLYERLSLPAFTGLRGMQRDGDPVVFQCRSLVVLGLQYLHHVAVHEKAPGVFLYLVDGHDFRPCAIDLHGQLIGCYGIGSHVGQLARLVQEPLRSFGAPEILFFNFPPGRNGQCLAEAHGPEIQHIGFLRRYLRLKGIDPVYLHPVVSGIDHHVGMNRDIPCPIFEPVDPVLRQFYRVQAIVVPLLHRHGVVAPFVGHGFVKIFKSPVFQADRGALYRISMEIGYVPADHECRGSLRACRKG